MEQTLLRVVLERPSVVGILVTLALLVLSLTRMLTAILTGTNRRLVLLYSGREIIEIHIVDELFLLIHSPC